MARARLLLTTFAVAAALTLTACGGGDPAPAETPTTPLPPPPAAAPGADCPEDAAGAQPVHFGPGETLGGLVYGTGDKALVLTHQSDGTLCQWAPYAKTWAEQGYRVLVFDFSRRSSSQNSTVDTATAAAEALKYVRSTGATGVTMIGASMGATAALVAASAAQPPVTAVISLSAPTYYDGSDALKAVANLTAPVLYAAADGDAQYAQNVEKLMAATPAATKKSVIIGGSYHGVDFIDPKNADVGKIRDAVADFLAAQMPA
ncbi:hypothetical protein Afil01_49960 [Actinorhabdospora filicis]|uniref:AB hydrolase-1 domain-containing protein n=1 Tax=Actinorhabdospora filicis TaxID=1785913 RepID=A0A9W6SNL0_9ACTN|nr:alpha/beta hydrolase [Actinorhabdospora filicis]GLZ80189.1 hypothetical protein Afil01_49960 [Actinorhabdospora filicis]